MQEVVFRDQRRQLTGDGGKQDVAAVHGVAHSYVAEQKLVAVQDHRRRVAFKHAGEEGAAVQEVKLQPGTAGFGGEEGFAGEVEAGEGACGDGGGVRRLGRDEGAVVQHADERRRVECAVAAEEAVVGDETAEGSARRGGAG